MEGRPLTGYCNGRMARNQGIRPCVMFDSDRLESVAGKSMSMDDIFVAVADFCGGTPLNDDCTVIELVYSGN